MMRFLRFGFGNIWKSEIGIEYVSREHFALHKIHIWNLREIKCVTKCVDVVFVY